jgi:hypothetical protein
MYRKMPLDPAARDKVVHPVYASQESGLPAARWADERGDPALVDVQANVEQHLLLTVPDVDAFCVYCNFFQATTCIFS